MSAPMPTPTVKLAVTGLTLLFAAACTVAPPEDVETSGAELGASAPLPARCANPVLRDCSFYASCLERARPCGSDGYALGYGDRYCRRFLASTSFSDKGVVWRDQTMLCLQRRLGRFLDDSSATCGRIIDGAFDDHPDCYTQPHASICDLSAGDWLAVLGTIDLGDLLSTRGRRQMAATAGTCISRWLTPPWLDATSEAAGHRSSETADLAAKRAIVDALDADPDTPLVRLRDAAELAARATAPLE